MQKITPFLWFDDKAEEAANFYTTIFENSRVNSVSRYDEASAKVSGRSEGSAMTVAFQLDGQEFIALNGGPLFNFTPAISFVVSCDSEDEIDHLWGRLSDGGETLMPLQKYPFSDKFGWTKDKFGVSWQLNLGKTAQKITPCLMYVGKQHGKAEEALNFYQDLFNNSRLIQIQRYESGQGVPAGTVQLARFTLENQEFLVMDSHGEHNFAFTEAISFLVACKNQEEVDKFWEKFTDEGEESQCGWLKDRYGVSWQIVPSVLNELLSDPDPVKAQRVTLAMLQMKKIDVPTLKQAYEFQENP